MKRAILVAVVLVGASLAGVGHAAALPPDDGDNESDGNLYQPLPDDDEESQSLLETLWNPLVVGAIVALGIGTVVVVERRASPADEDTESEPSPAERRRQAIGRAAGDLADDLAADRDAEELFGSWLTLADRLGLANPETVEEDRLRAVALDAGIEEDHADRLAEQYDVLRYGGAATAEREREAIEALRAIERGYAGDDADG